MSCDAITWQVPGIDDQILKVQGKTSCHTKLDISAASNNTHTMQLPEQHC
jgi:hypothetical protein